jgi:hypothetical protein
MRIHCLIAAAVVAAATLLGTGEVARANTFAAIAYSPATGSYGCWYGANCLPVAAVGALGNCGGPDRRLAVAVENGWAALAVNCNGGCGTGWSTNSRAEAECIALSGAGGNTCGARVLCWVASGT